MSEGSQVMVPSSFQALYREGPGRWILPVQDVADRYELCEDLAQHLSEHCRSLQVEVGVDSGEVLQRCLQGLLQAEAGVSHAEAHWVVTRLAELLAWPALPAAPGIRPDTA